MKPVDAGKLFGRGISFPPRLGADGRWAWSEGPENIRESIRTVLLTEQRERLMLPEFGGGLRPLLFEPNTPATRRLIQERITQSLARWEPRVRVTSVIVAEDPDEPRAAIVTISYQLVANQSRDEVSLTLTLGQP